MADYVVRLDLVILALVVASAIVTLFLDWTSRPRVKGRFSWRHWWHFPILSVTTILVGAALGFAIDVIVYRVFGVSIVWGLSSAGLMVLWIAAFGLVHFIWSIALLCQPPLPAASTKTG